MVNITDQIVIDLYYCAGSDAGSVSEKRELPGSIKFENDSLNQ